MTSTVKNSTSKNTLNLKLFVMFVFMFLSSTVMFGQSQNNEVPTLDKSVEVSTENTVAASTSEFAMWFIGSVNKTTNDVPKTISFGRKQLINSGITTNKVLIKTVLKKIAGQDSSLA
jgi:hypothetical protein